MHTGSCSKNMAVSIKTLELHDFKSYSGSIKIENIASITGIIGPNGSGKSNLMDAMAFLLAEDLTKLRVKTQKELLFGATLNVVQRVPAQFASVSAVFEIKNDSTVLQKRFTRIAFESHCAWQIDLKDVAEDEYLAELENLGINARTNNCIIFQGEVGYLLTLSTQEMGDLFERISGSEKLKHEYDALKRDLSRAEELVSMAHAQRRELRMRYRKTKEQLQEAGEYLILKKELESKNLKLSLFRLFHTGNELAELKNRMKREEGGLKKLEKLKVDLQAEQQNLFAMMQEARANEVKLENKYTLLECNANQEQVKLIKDKEAIAYQECKLRSAEECLKKAKKVQQAHLADIVSLQQELGTVAELAKKQKATFAVETQLKGVALLEGEKESQYYKLKAEVHKMNTDKMIQQDAFISERKEMQDKLDNEERKSASVESKLKLKLQEKEMEQERLRKLKDFLKSKADELELQSSQLKKLNEKQIKADERHEAALKELKSLQERLNDLRLDKQDAAAYQKKQEITEVLKEHYSGVHGRIIDLCKPIDKKYNVCLTKTMGSKMDAFVVDTAETAEKCIAYLRGMKIGIETFLPLDIIQAPRIKQKLRCIEKVSNTHLLFDLVKVEVEGIQPALLYCIQNTVVCETDEDASKVAYELQEGQFYDAVALDGTFYHASGIVSGGQSDLQHRAKRWDEKEYYQLKMQKDWLTEEVSQASFALHKKIDLLECKAKVHDLEVLIKYTKIDYTKTENHLQQLDAEIQEQTIEHESLKVVISGMAAELNKHDQRLEELKAQMDVVEDEVFLDFCRELGVSNIRQYENINLRMQQKESCKLQVFEDQKQRIESQLEYEMARTPEVEQNVVRWERISVELKQEVDARSAALVMLSGNLASKRKDLEANLEKRRLLVLQTRKLEIKFNQLKQSSMAELACKIPKSYNIIIETEGKIEKLKTERQDIVKHCKMAGIKIPLLRARTEKPTRVNDLDSLASSLSELDITDDETQDDWDVDSMEFDFHSLGKKLKTLDDRNEVSEMTKLMLQESQTAMEKLRQKKAPPPMLQIEKTLGGLKNEMNIASKKTLKLYEEARSVGNKFYRIKQKRYRLFMNCFDSIVVSVDSIYKKLNASPSYQATLLAINPEEPYAGGLSYGCILPGKSFQTLSIMSGGEQTMASLALLFAIQRFKKASILVIDEIDGSLDPHNMNCLKQFVLKESKKYQVLMISLNPHFFANAQVLIGITSQMVCQGVLGTQLIVLNMMPYHNAEEQRRNDEIRRARKRHAEL